jgi:hypothetical protein
MGKVVPCLIPYKLIFLFNFFDQDKVSFLLNQIVFSSEIHFKSKSVLLLSSPAQLLPSLVGPHLHARPTCTALLPYSHMTPDTTRPAPVSAAPVQLPRCRTPFSPCLHRAGSPSLSFFPCSGIEAAESSTAVSSGPLKTPRLSTPPHLSGLP